MSVVAFDLARGALGVPTPGPAGTSWDTAWSQFVSALSYTATARTGLQAASTTAGAGFTFDSALGDTVLRSASFAQSGGTLGTASAAATPLVTFDWTGETALRVELNAAWKEGSRAPFSSRRTNPPVGLPPTVSKVPPRRIRPLGNGRITRTDKAPPGGARNSGGCNVLFFVLIIAEVA